MEFAIRNAACSGNDQERTPASPVSCAVRELITNKEISISIGFSLSRDWKLDVFTIKNVDL